jgi:2-oxoisovalerate dehydrogenase E1 component
MLNLTTLLDAYQMMVTAKTMSDTFEAQRADCSYMHATSRGHEAIQIATGMQMHSCDWLSAYFRDDSLLLSLGFTPYELMLQLLAKKNDPFSGGRSYYSHPSSKDPGKPSIMHQSSATGMQAIPSTGLAHAIQIAEETGGMKLRKTNDGQLPIVICSMGDGAVTEGEVSEAFQFAVLKQLPIIYLVQDNGGSISAKADEIRTTNAYDFADGFKGMERLQCDGSNFAESYLTMQRAIQIARIERKPVLVHATLSIKGHSISGVRKESYRYKDSSSIQKPLLDPVAILRNLLLEAGITEQDLQQIETAVSKRVQHDFSRALHSDDPDVETVEDHVYAETMIKEEMGTREPMQGKQVMMVEAALHAIEELMEAYPETVLYGQEVGSRLGGVYRESDHLMDRFGKERVFNTAIQEAYIIGSTAGMSAMGMKPIVEVQFADYIYAGLNQLVTEISKSCYLSNGKFPVQMLLRVPVGAYGGGGPYHSGSIESTLLSIKGIKVVYPSNAADMKGLMKAALLDPNPVVMLEHKGLSWSKVPGTEAAQSIEPSADYIIPLGKARVALDADPVLVEKGMTMGVITYGMGVHWARQVAEKVPGQIEILDLRTLFPLDEEAVFDLVKRHGKVLILTEEPQNNSFTEALAHRITRTCYCYLDAPVEVVGALNLPAVPMQIALEQAMLPGVPKLSRELTKLLAF